jgi:hypothetical protein
MNAMLKRMRAMTDEEIHAVSEALDVELDRRLARRFRRGYQRSMYMHDFVRGRILAPYPDRNILAA